MADPFRYRAFISYSHEDEQWAAWLQHALERFRVPARLSSGARGAHIPRRLAPVFRDREDLSSASSLSDSIISALEESAALIVVCSPAAAASRWVNEEIRQFHALGRADQVFCLQVGGDLANPDAAAPVFPPALFEDREASAREPLAADPRESGDGKPLALLKIIAGLLGVRLDELRQRELRRRRRWQIGAASVVALALLMTFITVTSRISERHEREKAEQMATFIVDLGEDLQADVDLETLARIGTRAMGYLQNLDEDKLSLDTSIKVGLALRQLGQISLQQGRNEEAYDSLQRSQALFQRLWDEHPEENEVLFELSQAEFYVGNYYYELGNWSAAQQPWEAYLALSSELYKRDPGNQQWWLETSYSAVNLITLGTLSPQPVDLEFLAFADETVAEAKDALEKWPDNGDLQLHVPNTMAWAADAHERACDLDAVTRYRQDVLLLSERALAADPANRNAQRTVAYAHSGLAAALSKRGDLERAEGHLREALRVLENLWARDPSSQFLTTDIAANRRLLAALLDGMGLYQQASEQLQKARPVLAPEGPIDQLTQVALRDYGRYWSTSASLALSTGNEDELHRALRAISSTIELNRAAGQSGRGDQDLAARYRYLYWLANGEDPAENDSWLRQLTEKPGAELRSCYDADSGARLAVIEGDQQALLRETAYLRERGYRDPGFMRFCRQFADCDDQQ